MNPWDLVAAVQQRWKLVAAVTLAVFVAAMIWTLFFSARHYASSATLLFSNFDANPGNDKGADADAANAAFLGTQSDVIESGFVARQVVQALNLANQPMVALDWREATGGRGSLEDWLGQRLLNNLVVLPTKDTNVLRVTYTSTDPDYAAALANGFVDAYVKTQLMLRVQPAKVYSDWFQQRTADLRQRLEQAQQRLTDYQRKNGLVGGERSDVEMSRLAELSSQLATAEAASADAGARAGVNAAASPEVQSSAVVQGLKSSIATSTARLRQTETTLGPNHPDVISLRAELSTLQAKLAEAVGQATASVHVASGAAQGREAALRQRMADQRGQVLASSSHQDQLALLQRDVDTAKLAYDAVVQRLNSVRLQSEIPQASAAALDRAQASYLPVSPNIPLRGVLALMLGVGLGTTVALLLELRRPRARTAAGIAAATGLQTLATFERWPIKRRLSATN